MRRAKALDAEGKSLEAMQELESAVFANASHSGRTWLAFYLMRDGLEGRYLDLFQEFRTSWGGDAFMVFQKAQAQYRLDDLEGAEVSYRKVLDLSPSESLRKSVSDNLASLKVEQATKKEASHAGERARLGVLFGFVAMGLLSGFTWFFARRDRVRDEESSGSSG